MTDTPQRNRHRSLSICRRLRRSTRECPRAGTDFEIARRAASLIEILVVLSMMSMVMTGLSVALTSLFRLDSEARQDLLVTMSSAELELQLRADAHASSEASLVATEPRQELRFRFSDDRWVSYVWENERLSRSVLDGERSGPHRRFALPSNTALVWQVIRGEGGRSWVTISLVERGGPAGSVRTDRMAGRICTLVGLDELSGAGGAP